jgi:hypothetical protein
MIWFASYPRSGSNFLRIILHEVYGVDSSSYYTAPDTLPGYTDKPVIKTHHRPCELIPSDPSIPAIYLIRDGRDSIVSLAHHKKDFYVEGSDFLDNMTDAIIASRNTYFGGWSRNVREWLERDPLVLRFEELIKDPIGCVERLRSIMDLPEPNMEKLLTFKDLKTRNFEFGNWWTDSLARQNIDKFFRRGIVGSWRDEMPEDLHRLFWELHGGMMEALDYGEGTRPEPLKKHDKLEIYTKAYLRMAKRFVGRYV